MNSHTACTVILVAATVTIYPAVLHAEPGTGARPNRQAPLGINLSLVADYSSEMVFVDLFKQSRPWISQQVGKPWGTGPALDLTPAGWVRSLKPGQYATAVMCSQGGQSPGSYICLYEGEGVLDFAGNATIVRRTPGRIVLNVTEGEMILLHLRSTTVDNPVRNIRVITAASETTYDKEPFAPRFVKRTGQFRVIRFQDWMRTNNSTVREWSERPQATDATQAAKGVALEYAIQLCNLVHADPWICIPHLASDDYVRQCAELVRSSLNPELRVYIEHSNEVWNRGFGQARYAAEQGRKLNLAKNNDEYTGQLYYHARRSVEIFKIWEKVFRGTDRLVRVLGSQAANTWVTEQVVKFQEAYKHADAVGIAPYFGNSLGVPATASDVAGWSLDDVFEHCRQEIQNNRTLIEKAGKVAREHGLDIIAYETGQHLVGVQGAENNEKLTRLFHAANRDPRMKDLYLESMSSWKAAGGNLAILYSSVGRPTKWGSWGILEFDGQEPETAPKYQAAADFIKTTPAWWK